MYTPFGGQVLIQVLIHCPMFPFLHIEYTFIPMYRGYFSEAEGGYDLFLDVQGYVQKLKCRHSV